MNPKGMSRGRGRGCGYNSYSSSGPLMTEHLNISDLDRELELLRYKREAVQREQQQLSMECEMDRKRLYEHPNLNISNAYGNVWQASAPKRANNSQPPHPWMNPTQNSFGPNMSKSLPANYIPSLLSKKINPPLIPMKMKPIVHPILKNNVQRLTTPMNVRKDFRAPQGIRKCRKEPPNKLNTYPLKERKNLVSKATGSYSAKIKEDKCSEDLEAMTLREGRVPSNQVTGRLELALGSIVKEMISSHSQNDTFSALVSHPKQRRVLKQAVRERIRAVMLDKQVGSVVDIVDKYRERFPKRDDDDLVQLVVNTEQRNVDMKTENPQEFFTKNITSLLEKKIKEMSANLLKMYTNNQGAKALPINVGVPGATLENEMAMKVLRNLSGKYVTTEEINVLRKYYTELIEDILNKKLPEYLLQCKEDFLKIFDLDAQLNAIKSKTTEIVNEETKTKNNESSSPEEQNETNSEGLYNGNKLKEETVEDGVTNDNDEGMEDEGDKNNENTEDNKMPEEEIVIKDELLKKPDSVINATQKRTSEIDKAKEIAQAGLVAMDVQESSSTPKSSSEQQTSEARKPTLATFKGTHPPATPVAKKTDLAFSPLKSPATATSPMTKELPYYVKLIGRPTLPNRAAICDFLNNYRPNTIKKHKSINNLLVIGFTNEEDYKRILEANETAVGDITIVIKGSEKVNTGKENECKKDNKECEPKDGIKVEEKPADGSEICNKTTDNSKNNKLDDSGDLIGKELDDQISNLLTTIKQEDCEDNSKTNIKATSLETVKEAEEATKKAEAVEEATKNAEAVEEATKKAEAVETDKIEKIPAKTNVKEGGRSTPLRSTRLANVTPSSIRTRRASRLIQE